jgi:3-dehydroquinate synthetase
VPDEVTASAIWSVMATDKKRVANPLRFVLLRALGNVTIADNVPIEDIKAVLKESSG